MSNSNIAFAAPKTARDAYLILKASSLTDPELIAKKELEIIAMVKVMKVFAWISIIFGVAMLYIYIGVLFIILGIWLILRTNKRIALVKEGTLMYCKEINVVPVAS